MKKELAQEIAELQQTHTGLTTVTTTEETTTLSGLLRFEAIAEGYSPLIECFQIEISIPDTYPECLPKVRETDNKVDRGYEHINKGGDNDGTLCLAVPVDQRRVFLEQPTLLGFVNKLVIPFLFGYCHWKKDGTYPFGTTEHGDKGIVQHYVDILGLPNERAALAVVTFLYKGYSGRLPCPCGSGKRARKCHGEVLRALRDQHTKSTLEHDINSIDAVINSKAQTS